MADLQNLQLLTDVLLVVALFYLCVRVSKASPAIQSTQLEGNLRRMVQEADLALRTLQEKLVQRQTKLEELLLDIESSENRLNRSKQSVEESKADLETRFIKVQRVLQSLEQKVEPLKLSAETAPKEEAKPAEASIQAPVQAKKEEIELKQPIEAPIQAYGRGGRPIKKSAAASETAVTSAAVPSKPKTNIYGEIIQDPAPKKAEVLLKKSSLAASIEKEVYQAKPKETFTLDQVYDEAEELLRAGESLQRVAAMTSLSLDEVKMLARMADISIKPETNQEAADPRLGALAGRSSFQGAF